MLNVIKISILIFASLCLIGCSHLDSNIQWAIDNDGKTINNERGTKGIDIDFINTSSSLLLYLFIIYSPICASTSFAGDNSSLLMLFINSPQLVLNNSV
mgnify:CR=1 FL=1